MAQTDAPGVMTGKPLIESDRVEGTTVYDPQGNDIGSIKRLMIEKISGQVAYAVMSFGGFLGLGEEEHTIPQLRHQPRRLPDRHHGGPTSRGSELRPSTRLRLHRPGSRARTPRLLPRALLLG
jgi:PRC-barrel domain